jgi:arginyl-tRNA synthetase
MSKINENHAGAKLLANPLDICRSSLAEILSSLINCDVDDAYKSIQWPNNIFNGDLSVTVPRLQPGCKPTELSAKLVDKVLLSLHS